MTKDKRENFKKFAETHTNKALDEIDRLGSMGTRDYYEFSDEDVLRIYEALKARLEEMRKNLLARERPGTSRLDAGHEKNESDPEKQKQRGK